MCEESVRTLGPLTLLFDLYYIVYLFRLGQQLLLILKESILLLILQWLSSELKKW